ncbi:hypothetical protein HRbin23_01107 [bacterium HR23]|nr:hypothetical protein HRbin23_01107 [bacterium HR23]
MRIQGTKHLSSPVEVVWSALNDTAVLATCTPGCKSLTPEGESRYIAVMEMGIGPVKATFKGTVTVLERVQNVSYRLKVDASGSAGFARIDGYVALTPANAGTNLSYTAQVEVGGKIAGVGQRVLESVAKASINQFFTNLEKALARRQGLAGG